MSALVVYQDDLAYNESEARLRSINFPQIPHAVNRGPKSALMNDTTCQIWKLYRPFFCRSRRHCWLVVGRCQTASLMTVSRYTCELRWFSEAGFWRKLMYLALRSRYQGPSRQTMPKSLLKTISSKLFSTDFFPHNQEYATPHLLYAHTKTHQPSHMPPFFYVKFSLEIILQSCTTLLSTSCLAHIRCIYHTVWYYIVLVQYLLICTMHYNFPPFFPQRHDCSDEHIVFATDITFKLKLIITVWFMLQSE